MAKYRAKEDIPPGVKKGDIVELTEDPVPGMKERLEAVSDSEETTAGQPADLLTGLSRDELKAKADELGVDYPGNISTAKLLEAVKEKMAEDAEAGGEGTDGNDNPDD